MRAYGLSGWIGLVLAALVLSGCYGDATPTRYEPGEYKGSDDPLLDKLKSGDLHETLNERFTQAARDR